MIPSWLIYTTISGLSSVVSNTVNRQTLNKINSDSTVFAWLFEVIRLTIFLPLIFFQNHVILSPINLFYLIALGLSELVSVYLYAKMHSKVELSLSSTLVKLRIVFVPIFAFLFLGEQLTQAQYIGIALTFIGCIVVAPPSNFKSNGNGIWYAVAFALVNALSSIILKHVASFSSTVVTMIAFCLPAALLIPVIMKSPRLRIGSNYRVLIMPIAITVAFNTITMYAQIEALRYGLASQVLGIFTALTTVSVLVGIIFLKERDKILAKITGAALTLIGVILLI